MSYKAIIVSLSNVREHGNADRLQLGTVCGNQVIVGLDAKTGDRGIYFDTDGQLTEYFMKHNNLHRHADRNADVTKSGMFEDNGRVRAQKFRGEKSEGFWIPLLTVQKNMNASAVPLNEEGLEFDTIGKELICLKYVNPKTLKKGNQPGNSTKIKNTMFHQHFDTDQFGRNSWKIPKDAHVIITEKVHGTSQRVGHVLAPAEPNWFQRLFNITPKMIWRHLIGTRRVILRDDVLKADTGWHSSSFRVQASEEFLGNLRKGETVYYEVVGYEGEEAGPIMGTHSNEKLKAILDKDEYKQFINTFGDTTVFTYGCAAGEFKTFVYRMTMTNEDGQSIDYSWEAVKQRCNELGVQHVEELITCNTNQWEDDRDFVDYVKAQAECLSTSNPWGHVGEGVCVRVEGITPIILKEKNFAFKVLEGIIKDSGVVDEEEAQSIEEEVLV